ncbi:hypothetical protein BV898_17740 [Hypsibius exemplaris]|uniref:Uncharacterized protein n=1 Tax=Hypsibius exemplaris TaxID=2072580 RepID=A0A9X6NG57_HYPEX|nr:hypothetical protein BV898_17740 [Hypsibius exemplaris]
MMAKSTVLSIALVLLSLFQLGAATSESRDVRQYNGVRAGAAFKVSITINGQEGVTVHAPTRRSWRWWKPSSSMEFLLSVSNQPSGVEQHSAGCRVQPCTANLQGSSTLDVSGSATTGQITAQGSSQFNGLDLRLTTAQVTGQGLAR